MELLAQFNGHSANEADFKLRNLFAAVIPGVKSTAELEREKEAKRREEELALQRQEAERKQAEWALQQQILAAQAASAPQVAINPVTGLPEVKSGTGSGLNTTTLLIIAGVVVVGVLLLRKKE